MVTGTSSGGFVGYFASLGVGSMSPSSTDCLGTSPAISSIYYAFGFTVFEVTGTFDNSSIVSMTLTPSGGSSTTFTFNSHVQSSGVTRFSTSSGSALSNNTTYTVQINGDTTDVNTERATLERRTPTGLDDFFGATRNVQPISGVMKLSYLHDAVKRQFSSGMTLTQYTYQSLTNYIGYSTTLLPSLGLSGTLGSMSDSSVDSIINFYNGATVYQFLVSQPVGTSTFFFTFGMTHTATNRNSEWYKVSYTPSGGSEVAFYREDLTYTRSGTSHLWSKDIGLFPFSAGSGTFKLTC
tara:strand:+ start:388 stop:1272 length:885 start_codon:yes stop_codon:yes gene_type:complete